MPPSSPPSRRPHGGEITVTGSGTDFKVDDSSTVVRGNVRTSNATVRIIDTVAVTVTGPAGVGLATPPPGAQRQCPGPAGAADWSP